MGMRIDLRAGDKIQIGDVTITLEEKSGQRARLNVEAPDSVRIAKKAAESQIMAARNGIAYPK